MSFFNIIILQIIAAFALNLWQKYRDYKRKKMERDFLQLRLEIMVTPRQLTRKEYQLVKLQDWYNQRKFLIDHLTYEGFLMYNNSSSEGRNGKWFAYLRIWEIINSPLFKSLTEK